MISSLHERTLMWAQNSIYILDGETLQCQDEKCNSEVTIAVEKFFAKL